MEETSPEVPKLHPARHLFSTVGLVVVTMVIVGTFVLTAFVARSVIQSGQLAAVISAALVELANEDRSQQDLGTLAVSPVLVAAAQAKANDMAEKGYFAHISPAGVDPWFWMREEGYAFTYAGENLAVNFSDSEDVENAWMNSPGHRANILNGRFTEIGVATAVGEYKGHKTTFVVQMFGTPRSIVAETPVRPLSSPEDPEEPALATTEPEEDTAVLGSEVEAPVAIAPTVPSTLTNGDVALTSPQSLLRVLYIVCALIILVALLLATRSEFKRHHLRHVVAASLLLVLMGGLFAVADWIIFTDPIVGQELARLGS